MSFEKTLPKDYCFSPAAVFVPFIFGLFWQHTNRRAAFWSMLSAAVLGVVSQALWYREVDGWLGAIHPLFLGPALGLVVLSAASIFWPAAQSSLKQGEAA